MKKINNYVKIPTDYLEAKAKIRIPGSAVQVLEVIERKTFGWQKNHDGISICQFKDMTGIDDNRNIQRNLDILKKMKIIKFEKHWGIRTEYEIEQDFSLWEPVEKPVEKLWKSCGKAVEKSNVTVVKNDDTTVVKNDDTQSILSNNKRIKGGSIYREKRKNSLIEKNKDKKSKNEEVKK